MSTVNTKPVARVIPALAASDGAGVRIRRSLGNSPSLRVDPFLMLDEFGSDRPEDYRGGFPPHPHRGFETVTYMLAGRMRHEDHMGNRGDLGPGDVQWMTAGRGIVHSEMPQQEEGLMHGFQLWLNLPSHAKMQPAAWSDIPAARIPVVTLPHGGEVRVIAGEYLAADGTSLTGPAKAPETDPLYLDISLDAGGSFTHPVPVGHNAFVYVYAGSADIDGTEVRRQNAAVLGDGNQLLLRATGDEELRALLIAGRPLNEPVVQYGPFVMNTREEIEATLQDYRDGRLTAA